MSLLTIIIVLVVVGVILWAVNTYIPMEPGIKKLLNVVVIVLVLLWLIQALGLLGPLNQVKVGG